MTRLISDSWQNCDCDVLVMSLCEKYGINLNLSSIERAHRINARQKDAPIIVKLLNFKDKLKILREKQKMRENGVLVVEDFPSEVIHRRRQFSTVLKAAYNSPKNYKAHLSVDKLILDGKSFITADLDKLPAELRPSNLCIVTKGNITAFFTSHSKLSNHYLCTFSVNGLTSQLNNT